MRKTIITSLLIILVLLLNFKVTAQQAPNFTLYNFNMNIINPAFAGIKENPELNLVYRNQFIGIQDAPRTISMAYSRGIGNNLGLGISVINDRVFVLDQTDIALDISYKLKIAAQTHLYFGIKAGGGFADIDLTSLNTPVNDPLFSENQSFFNPHFGAGIVIKNEKFYVSISTPNFLQGARYQKQGNIPIAALDASHFYLGAAYNFQLKEHLILTPRFMMRTVKGAPNSYDAGASLDIHHMFTLGANTRIAESTSIYGLISATNQFKLGFAYDIQNADLNDNGSLEFILKYQFNSNSNPCSRIKSISSLDATF